MLKPQMTRGPSYKKLRILDALYICYLRFFHDVQSVFSRCSCCLSSTVDFVVIVQVFDVCLAHEK